MEEELASYPKKPGRPCRRKRELLSRLKELREMLPEGPEATKKQGRPRKGALSPEHQEEIDLLASRAKDIKKSRYALGRNPENCTEYQTEKIKLIENSYPDLYRAYQLKETLRLILHMKDAGLAEEELDKWIEGSASSGLAPMEELSAKILRHRENILHPLPGQQRQKRGGEYDDQGIDQNGAWVPEHRKHDRTDLPQVFRPGDPPLQPDPDDRRKGSRCQEYR